jgi:predicted secreted protein
MTIMMKIKAIFLASFVILFQSTLCDTIRASDNFLGEEMVIVQKEQSGQTITVKAGDIIQTELAEIGSAGYRWYIDNLDARYLELVSEETRKVSEEGKIGAPVMRVWCFKAKKVGQTEIKMDYYRKWEAVDKSTDSFFIKINIIKNGR